VRDAEQRARRLGAVAAASTLLGIVVSGPLALLVVNATHPQPPWQGPELYARSFHAIQVFPYLGGLLLVAGLVLLITSMHALAREDQKPLTSTAVVLAAVFATFIFFNYVVQTSYLPTLARQYGDRYAGIVATFSMANPTSLAWAIEMWGYAFIGVATWLVAPVFHGSRLARLTAWTFIANGPVSLAGGIVTTALPGWAMTTVGLVAFSLWNVLLGVMAALALVMFRRGLVFRRANPARRLGSPANIAACEA
jgi:MFS family permease